jgi:uncharacterized protein
MSGVINSIVLKVASRCNINCTYCYEYNRGDDTWRGMPKAISNGLAEQVGRRVRDYCISEELDSFQINLHGGEPFIIGAQKIDGIISCIKRAADGINVSFGAQTNGTLITDEILDVIKLHNIKVGVSLDGDEASNMFRVDHEGHATWARAVDGLSAINSVGALTGIQAVINLESDPHHVLEVLSRFRPPVIELSQPFGNYVNPPPNYQVGGLGEWLSRGFVAWVKDKNLSEINVSIFTDAIRAVLGGETRTEWFPKSSLGFFVVATDGSYEGFDALKVVGTYGRVLEMNVGTHGFSEVLNHDFIRLRREDSRLPDACSTCDISDWCNGGFLPTRYSKENGFNNPSLYCTDLQMLFRCVATWLLQNKELPGDIARSILDRKWL